MNYNDKDMKPYIEYLKGIYNTEKFANLGLTKEFEDYIYNKILEDEQERQIEECIEAQETAEYENEREYQEQFYKIVKNFTYELKNMEMSQQELGDKVGVSQGVISRYKNGRIPNLVIFARICKVLNIDPNEILFD